MLCHFFTGTDTLTLIETSQIRSFSDFVGFFTQPLMAHSEFVEIGKFFRPVATLTYSLDYWIWELDPFGFHLTNLLLNLLAACLLVLLMYELSRGNLLFSWLTGLIFAVHPILVESVPAIDRRHDVLLAVFFLLSFYFFLKSMCDDVASRPMRLLSVFFYCLALGAKETAVILPLLVQWHAYRSSSAVNRSERFISATRQVCGYWIATILYLLWRTTVLGGLGGYSRSDPLTIHEIASYVINIVHNYIIDLLYPADPIGALTGSLAHWWPFIVLVIFGLYILAFFRTEPVLHDRPYRRESVNLLSCLGFWLLLPLLLFVCTLTFAHRNMYNPAMPFSALLAYPVAETLRRVVSVGIGNISISRPFYRSDLFPKRMLLGVGISMMSYLFVFSPLVRNYEQWGVSARIGRIVLTHLASGARDFPDGCRVNLYNLPDGLKSYESINVKAKEVTYLSSYSIKSWLRLCGFKKSLDVIIHSRSRPFDFSGELSITMKRLGGKSLFAIVKTDRLAHRSGTSNLFP